MARVFVGLGTNMGQRGENLIRAMELMETSGIHVIMKSSILETEPVENTDQPVFLNQVILAQTALTPSGLLLTLLDIERSMGRVRDIFKGPRIIDLDILLYDCLVMETSDLVIPHPAITSRPFVMKHLVELDEKLRDPRTGVLYRDILGSTQVPDYAVYSG